MWTRPSPLTVAGTARIRGRPLTAFPLGLRFHGGTVRVRLSVKLARGARATGAASNPPPTGRIWILTLGLHVLGPEGRRAFHQADQEADDADVFLGLRVGQGDVVPDVLGARALAQFQNLGARHIVDLGA